MKILNIRSVSIVAAMVIGLAACEKQLELAPYNAFTDESVFTTPERVNLAINGVYDAAQSGFYNGAIDRGYPFGAANVEQGDNRGEDVVNLQAFYQITYQSTYTPSSANNVNHYNSTYRLINFANVAIEGIQKALDGGIIAQDVATRAIAEMKFLRALSHHELLMHFARPYLDGNGENLGVNYRDFPVNSGAAVDAVRADARPKVSFTYQRILEDLDAAIADLPEQQPTASLRKIRAEKGAAITLKMRVLMHMGRFQEAKAEGDKLVPASVNPLSPTSVISPIGGYALTASPEDAFASNSVSSENIFTIKNDPLDNPNVNGALPAMYGPANLGGRGLVAISPIIWNRSEWLADDERRTTLYAMGSNAAGNQSVMTTKYRDYVQRGSNNPIFRYAEVLLMLAECEARLNNTARALDLLNVVRNRSLANPATQQYSAFANATDLLKAILLERRFEFAMEGKRWHDIHRLSNDPVAEVRIAGIPAKLPNGADGAAIYGIGVAVNPTWPAIPYSDYRFIWPIPVDEITQNPVIVQNPQY